MFIFLVMVGGLPGGALPQQKDQGRVLTQWSSKGAELRTSSVNMQLRPRYPQHHQRHPQSGHQCRLLGHLMLVQDPPRMLHLYSDRTT